MFFGKEELIKIAEIQRTHGVDGKVLLNISQDFDKSIFTEDLPVFLIIDGMPVPFFIEHSKSQGKNVVVKLRHIESLEKAEKFVGTEIMTLKSLFDDFDKDEDNEKDIEGYSVYDKKFGFIGQVCMLNNIPGNPVIEINFKEKIIIIPYAEDIILEINDEKKEIQISAPEGLIDLYLEM